MADPDDMTRVKQWSSLGRLSVLTLEADSAGPSFRSVFEEVVTTAVQIIVVDCLDIAALPVSTCSDLIDAHRQLIASQRQLIVVNAPEQALPELRSQGVEVATTTDQTFGAEVVDPIHAAAYLEETYRGGRSSPRSGRTGVA